MGDLLGSDGTEVLILLRQGFELFLCLDNLPFQSIILVLTEGAIFQLLLCLRLCIFQGVQFLFCFTDGIFQQALLLRE